MAVFQKRGRVTERALRQDTAATLDYLFPESRGTLTLDKDQPQRVRDTVEAMQKDPTVQLLIHIGDQVVTLDKNNMEDIIKHYPEMIDEPIDCIGYLRAFIGSESGCK